MIKCVIFDVDGTLLNNKKDFLETLLLAYNKFDFKCNYVDITSQYGRTFKEICEFGNITKDKAFYYEWVTELIKRDIKLFDNIIEVLNSLSDYTLGIISSRSVDDINYDLEKYKINKYFKIIVGSNTVSMPKPNKESIDYIMNNYGFKNDEIVYIGDLYNDYMFAKNSNIKFFHANWGKSEKINCGIILNDPLEVIKNVDLCNMKNMILDMDGTLLDSMKYWYTLAPRFLEDLGYKTTEEFNSKFDSLTLPEAVRFTIETYKLNIKDQELIDKFIEMMEYDYVNTIELKNGVYDFISQASKKGIKMVVATATNRYLTEKALKRLNIYDYLEGIITCEEVNARKSKPDVYNKALEMLGGNKKNTFIFEDVLFAIKTAKQNNYYVVGVYDATSNKNTKEIKELSDFYIESFENWKW